MTKYAVSAEGVAALRSVSAALTEAFKSMEMKSDTMIRTGEEHRDTLGPHAASLLSALEQIEEAQKKASSEAAEIAAILTDVADEYQEIIDNDPLVDVDSTDGTVPPGGTDRGGSAHGFFAGQEAKLGKSFVSGMESTLSKSSHADVRRAFKTYGAKLTVADAHHKGGAYFCPADGVHMNADVVQKGDFIHAPYQTAFHEFGHNLDYVMGNGSYISETWKDGALLTAIQEDFRALKGSKTDAELIASLKSQMQQNGWSIKDVASVSDILESQTGMPYPLGVGHGVAYWKSRTPCLEFFAEVIDGASANERSYAVMKQMFPRAVAVVHEILGGMAQ